MGWYMNRIYGQVCHIDWSGLKPNCATESERKVCIKQLGNCAMVSMFLASCSSWPVAVQGVRSFLAHKKQPEQISGSISVVYIVYCKVKIELQWCVHRSTIGLMYLLY